VITEVLPHSPVPVGAQAIAPPEPDSKNKPGECCKQEGCKIQFPELRKYPSQAIKKNQ